MSQRNKNGEWRRLHNEELHSFRRSSNRVRVKIGRASSQNERRWSPFKIISGKTTVKGSPERPRRRCERNIAIDL